jgi:hypothetical protein
VPCQLRREAVFVSAVSCFLSVVSKFFLHSYDLNHARIQQSGTGAKRKRNEECNEKVVRWDSLL